MAASLKGSERRFTLRSLATRLRGYEIDPFAAWMSAVFLDATLNEEFGFAGDESFAPIEVCDSLMRGEAEPEFDLIVANPPYGRVKLTTELREIYKRSLYGHANLYGLFLDLGLRTAKPGAVIAYVTPTSFLCGEYFKNLRALLGREAPPFALEFISERSGVFDDVLQETLLAVFQRGVRGTEARVNFVEVSPASGLAVTGAGAVPLANPPEQPWIVPRHPTATALAAKLRAMPHRLADWGYGVSTGPLVWNRFKGQLRDQAGSNTVPLIWAEAVTADGEFAFRADRRNHSPYFSVKNGDDALLVRRSCVLLQRTTAKEQPRRLVAAELPQAFLETHDGAVTVENHLNMVVTITPNPPVDTRTLAAFLNSSAADRAFRCISGTVAVSAYELEAMPLPPSWAMRGLTELLSEPHERADIEAYCNRLYGDR
jgi:adenine-specific DNA-methyltransferase